MNTKSDYNQVKTPSISERVDFKPLRPYYNQELGQAEDDILPVRLKFKYNKNIKKKIPKHTKTVLPTININKLKTGQKFNTLLTFLISLFIVIGNIYQSDEFYNQNYELTTDINIVRIFLVALTGLQIVLVVFYYKNALKIKISYKILSKHSAVYQDKDILARLILELLISIIVIPPYFEYTFIVSQLSIYSTLSTSDILLALIFLKTYYLFKFVYEISFYNSTRSLFYCDLLKIENKFSFTMKSILKKRPFSSIILVVILTSLIFGVLLHTYEKTIENSPLKSTWNSIWLVCVTQSTVGYGDYAPYSHIGRCVIALTTYTGYFIYSYTTLIVKSETTLKPKQYVLYSEIKAKKVISKKLKTISAVFIQRWFKLIINRRKKISSIPELYNLNKQIRIFSYYRTKYVQENAQTLQLCIDKLVDEPITKLRNLNKSLQSVENSEMQALRLANMNYSKLQKIKRYNRYMRKFLLSQASTYETEYLEVTTSRRRQIKTSEKISLKKSRGEAIKNMIVKRYSKSICHSQESVSSEYSPSSLFE